MNASRQLKKQKTQRLDLSRNQTRLVSKSWYQSQDVSEEKSSKQLHHLPEKLNLTLTEKIESNDTLIMPDQPVTMGQLLQLFSQINTNKPPPPPPETITNTTTISIPTFSMSEKLTHQNYTMWSRLMQLALSGRDRLNHIIADPPPQTDQEYSQ